MNRLILIGNGFDLAHGLKTSYQDFILDYYNSFFDKLISSKEKRIGYDIRYECWHEDDLMEISIRNLPNIHFNNGLSSKEGIKKQFKDANSIKEIQQLAKQYDCNITYKGFNITSKKTFPELLLDSCINKNWVDIESLYYEGLKKLLKDYNKSKEYDGTVSGPLSRLEYLNKQFNFIKERLEKYLLRVQDEGCFRIDQIEDYLYKIRYGNYTIGKVMLLNFNYTNTPDHKYANTSNSTLLNIHGQLNNKSNEIIFGYGDEVDKYYKEIEDLNENEFFKHIKSFDYFKTSNYKKLMTFINTMNSMARHESFEVYIMGHSCGLSDRTMLHSIFTNPNCSSIRIFYNPKDENDYRSKTYEISRHFSDKASMRKKIVPFPECSPMPQYNE